MVAIQKKYNVFIDDVRTPPSDEWVVLRTFHEAVTFLDINFEMLDRVMLDHDLGCYYGNREMTGADISAWIIQNKHRNENIIITCHSDNPAGKSNIERDIISYSSKR